MMKAAAMPGRTTGPKPVVMSERFVEMLDGMRERQKQTRAEQKIAEEAVTLVEPEYQKLAAEEVAAAKAMQTLEERRAALQKAIQDNTPVGGRSVDWLKGELDSVELELTTKKGVHDQAKESAKSSGEVLKKAKRKFENLGNEAASWDKTVTDAIKRREARMTIAGKPHYGEADTEDAQREGIACIKETEVSVYDMSKAPAEPMNERSDEAETPKPTPRPPPPKKFTGKELGLVEED